MLKARWSSSLILALQRARAHCRIPRAFSDSIDWGSSCTFQSRGYACCIYPLSHSCSSAREALVSLRRCPSLIYALASYRLWTCMSTARSWAPPSYPQYSYTSLISRRLIQEGWIKALSTSISRDDARSARIDVCGMCFSVTPYIRISFVFSRIVCYRSLLLSRHQMYVHCCRFRFINLHFGMARCGTSPCF